MWKPACTSLPLPLHTHTPVLCALVAAACYCALWPVACGRPAAVPGSCSKGGAQGGAMGEGVRAGQCGTSRPGCGAPHPSPPPPSHPHPFIGRQCKSNTPNISMTTEACQTPMRGCRTAAAALERGLRAWWEGGGGLVVGGGGGGRGWRQAAPAWPLACVSVLPYTNWGQAGCMGVVWEHQVEVHRPPGMHNTLSEASVSAARAGLHRRFTTVTALHRLHRRQNSHNSICCGPGSFSGLKERKGVSLMPSRPETKQFGGGDQPSPTTQ